MKFMIASDLHGSAFYARKLAEIFRAEGADVLVLLGDIYNHGPRNPLPEEYAPLKVAEVLNGLADRLLVIKGNCDSDVDTLISEFEFVQHGDRFSIGCLPKNCGDGFFYGHYHTSFLRREGKVLVANPGSVSLPKQGTARGYLLLEDGAVTLKDLDGAVRAEETL